MVRVTGTKIVPKNLIMITENLSEETEAGKILDFEYFNKEFSPTNVDDSDFFYKKSVFKILVVRAQKGLRGQVWACWRPNDLFLKAVLNFWKSNVDLPVLILYRFLLLVFQKKLLVFYSLYPPHS